MKNEILILSGPVQSGKTTRLLDWALGRNDVSGVVTPVVKGRRYFFDLKHQQLFLMEADERSRRTISVGKYIFSLDAFEQAEKIISACMQMTNGYLVIDEIGPLELGEKGFCHILRQILNIENRNFKLVLVIRETKLDDVKKFFKIGSCTEFKFNQD